VLLFITEKDAEVSRMAKLPPLNNFLLKNFALIVAVTCSSLDFKKILEYKKTSNVTRLEDLSIMLIILLAVSNLTHNITCSNPP